MNNELAASSVPMAADDWWTTISLAIIAIGVVLALLVIWRGARLKRERQAVDEAIDARAEDAFAGPVTASIDDMPPPAPETTPVATPPVAPAPPPLAAQPAPVVVAAPPAEPLPPAQPLPAADPQPAAEPLAAAEPPPAANPAVSGTDDLTQLKGVGPKLAARLAELGITSFAQVAALSPDAAAALDAQLGAFQGRMARDRWIEQADYLAKGDLAGFETAFGKL
ncbi:helix-hairpin-helix domain-containing protein [Sphingomonas sp.]|uniref:helix-hairpin-helix domain-containing protein n=1 Tax=Sphingomonas sp. TaxID=28214 RepID=UPI002DD65B46|nr:helix-hairpin-helix domain-containing protein [Sphingomonas sp.]